MDNSLNLCMRCMNELLEDGTCSHCGLIEHPPVLPCFLAPHTILDDRYLVGDVLTSNGESTTYIGYDNTLLKKVYIKEFMPQNICVRDDETDDIIVSSENIVTYKNYLAEYIELNKFLMRMKSLTHIMSINNIVYKNNTAYSISDYTDAVTLKEYISRNGNILSWTEIKTFLPPILTTLSLVHNVGKFHLGISPDTIIFTSRGELKITGFCILDERMADSRLIPELFSGYSAPEQYLTNSRVGEYSDVYAICAVMYRALTGITPPESIVRTVSDNLKDISEINNTIPSEVLSVIKAGMNVNSNDRIQSVSELVNKIFEQPQYVSENEHEIHKLEKTDTKQVLTAKTSVKKKNKDKQNKKPFKYKFVVEAFLVSLVILIPVMLALIWFVLGSDDDTSTIGDTQASIQETMLMDTEVESKQVNETISEENNLAVSDNNIIHMPNLIGMDYDSVIEAGKVDKVLDIQPEYKFSDEYSKNIIMDQSILEDTYVEEGTKVIITVSKGSSVVKVPDYTGMSKKDYLELLDSMNIKYDVEYVDTYEVLDEYVVRTNKHIGDKIDLLKGDVLKVYIANGMAITPDTTTETTQIVQ